MGKADHDPPYDDFGAPCVVFKHAGPTLSYGVTVRAKRILIRSSLMRMTTMCARFGLT